MNRPTFFFIIGIFIADSLNAEIINKNERVFASIEALNWKASEKNLAIGSLTQITTSSTTVKGVPKSFRKEVAEMVLPDFTSDWGFRFKVGTYFPKGSWDCVISWTRFYSSSNAHITLNNSNQTISDTWANAAFAELISAPPPIISISGVWNIHLQILDILIGKHLCVGKHLVFKPYTGLKGGWIFQKYDQKLFRFGNDSFDPSIHHKITDQLRMKDNFAGAGLAGGCQGRWNFFKEISIYADMALSLLYGTTTLARRDSIEALTFQSSLVEIMDNVNPIHEKFQCLAAIGDMILGIQWDHKIKNRVDLCFNFGWEEHIFFGQNQFLRPTDANIANSDMKMTGWTLGARIAF